MGRPRSDAPPLRRRGDVWYAVVYVGGRAVERSTGERDRDAAARVAASWATGAATPARDQAPPATLNDALADLIEDRRAKARGGDRSERTVDYYETKAGSLLACFGHEFLISAWERDSSESWTYIRWRRASGVADLTTFKELGVLRTALSIAAEQGLFHGSPKLAIPASFKPGTSISTRSPTRQEFLKLVPHLHPDAAAVVAFVLATSAEWSALERAESADLPKKLAAPFRIHVRGSKNEGRDRHVHIVTDEQVALVKLVKAYAKGEGGKLFASLGNFDRTLKAACEAAGIEAASAGDFRHAAGQWLLDVGTPVELVSRNMGHASTAITERVYARVKSDLVGDRMLDAIPSRYTRGATRARSKADRVVATVTAIPAPKTPTYYEVRGVERTLSGWAQASGIKKNTLHSRLAAGMSMAEAVAKGPGGVFRRSTIAGKLPGNPGIKRPLLARPAEARIAMNQHKTRGKGVSRVGLEPTTYGLKVRSSTD